MTEKDLVKLEKLAMMKDDSDLAFLDEAEKTNEHLSEIHEIQNQALDVLRQIEQKEVVIPKVEIPKFPTSISISNLPKIQQVEVINQSPAPIVNINVPDVILPEFPQFPPIPETKISILTKELEEGLITIADVLKEIRGMTEKNGRKEMVLTNHGYSAVNLKNNAGLQINPATEEKQDTQILHTTDQTTNGTLAVLNDTVELILNAKANTVFQITYSSFVGKIMFEAQVDSIWAPVYAFLAGTGQSKTEYSNPASGNMFRCSSAGFMKIRVRLSLATSGSATIYAVATNVTSGVFINFPLPEGGNIIGQVGVVDESEVRMTPAKETGGNLASIKTATESKYITGIGDGRKVVTTAGTALALATSTPCKKVTITAETDNTGIIVVGGSTVVGALATRRGTPLNAGDSYEFDIDNLADVYLDTTVSGDGVTFTWFL